jgi:hypothetical protein
MSTSSSGANVPDILIGIGLFLLIPLLGYALIGRPDGSDASGQGLKSEPLLTREEVTEMRDEYIGMYDKNAQLFLARARAIPEHAAQEYAWARKVLERCRAGFADLRDKIKSNRTVPELEDELPKIETWISKIEGDLKEASPAQ